MPDYKTPAIKRTQFFRELSEASEASYSVNYIYFDEKEDLKAKFKMGVSTSLKLMYHARHGRAEITSNRWH